MSDLDNNTYYGKLSKLGRAFNKLDLKATTEAIKTIQAQRENNMSISKADRNKEMQLKKEERENIVPYIRNNIESINRRENQRASSGEER